MLRILYNSTRAAAHPCDVLEALVVVGSYTHRSLVHGLRRKHGGEELCVLRCDAFLHVGQQHPELWSEATIRGDVQAYNTFTTTSSRSTVNGQARLGSGRRHR